MNYLTKSISTLLLLSLTSCSNNSATHNTPSQNKDPRFQKISTVNIPARSAEIISYAPSQKVLLATNSVAKNVLLFDLPDPANGNPQPLDTDLNTPGIQGLNLNGEPTSITTHPNGRWALTAVNGNDAQPGGRLVIFDITAAKTGQKKIILDQKVGIHLDSIAVSRNAQWVVLCDEAEGDSKTEGAILVGNLAQLKNGRIPFSTVPDLAAALGRPAGRVEPEFVSIDSTSRLAAISCQDDNAIVLISLSNSPRILQTIALPNIAQPDGISLYNHGNRLLLGIAEEVPDKFSIYEINRQKPTQPAALLSRIDISQLAGSGNRSDPENVVFFKQSGHHYAALAVERANRVALFNIDNPRQPKKVALFNVGSRPEGLIAIPQGHQTILISGDEGKPGKGEISFMRIR